MSSKTMYCANCGTAHDETEAFCPECGTPTETTASSESPTPHAPVSKPPVSPVTKKPPLSKQMLAIIGGGAALLVIVIILIASLSGGRSPVVGTWEAAVDTDWRTRWTYNRDGTGLAFELNVNTGMTRNERAFSWSTSRDFQDLLRLEHPDTTAPDESFIEWLEFTITVNAIGEQILNIRHVGGRLEWSHFRRIN